MVEECLTCRERVNSEDKAILCEICESWEHVACIRASDRPSEALYDAMVSCRSKAVVFTCTSCRKRGSIVKRIMQHEMDSARADDERLASARLLQQKGETVARLEAEVKTLRMERDDLYKRLLSQATVSETVKPTTDVPLLQQDAVEASASKVEAGKKEVK